jgi:serine/threonine-protein kinase
MLDLKSLQAVAEDPNPVEALERRGLLDPDEATALFRILDDNTRPAAAPPPVRPGAVASTAEEPPVLPTFPGMEGLSPWDSLPSTGPTTDGSGRQVLRVLTLPAWNHYRNLRFIAEGGMGRVFRAFDPSLKRRVALKFLRRDDPELVARFVLEAQHQAMVEHPNICRVYEVGEWQGQSYIAMQFIQGETLEAAMPGLSLLEKVQVIEAVAEAIHAAHRVGLIHRDLKPSNIMVSRQEQGLAPSILDFGLARGIDAAEFTQDGLAVGTVHYMAPEQVRGQHARINRQTDVYGLGATLHKILTGEAPFAAFNGVEAFRRTVETDVPPLRRLVPELPADLDTITRKCLEKDPARRYENALAVADDLRRWLAGEPILARKPTLSYLVTKWARRHKLVVAVAGAGILATLGLGGVALVTASRARAQAQYAQHFGQEAERIEALLRYASLLPPHDVRPELAQARARMATLELEAQRAGRLASGPSAYALGRSHLALGDAERARPLLEAAWAGGLHTPEVALALGRALAASYQQELDLARALPSKELREARERELVRDLRDPALARLREGAPAALESPAYQEALVAFMGGQWDLAQTQARAALAATPWLFEAKRLEGEALLERAKVLQNPSEALTLLLLAEQTFAEASRLGPSDPTTALDEVRVLSDRASVEIASGRQAAPTLTACRKAVARVQLLRPDSGEAKARLARSLAHWADLQRPLGPSVREAFQEAQAHSREGLAREPDNPAVVAIRIRMLISAGMIEFRNQGRDPLPAYREALELARKAQARHPQEPTFASLVALACMRKMSWEINTGTPPWASFEEGLSQARALRERFPGLPGAHQGLAALWVERAEFERVHGLDPRPSVAATLDALAMADGRGLRLGNPGWTFGDAHLIRGQYLLATEGGGETDFEKAAEGYRQALRANPKQFAAHGEVAEAALGVAQGRLERGLDPSPALDEAQASLDRLGGRDTAPDQAEHLRGQLALLQGRQRLASGGDPSLDWARAETRFRKAFAFTGLAKAQVGVAEVRARAYFRAGKPQDRAQALAAARAALKRDPLRAEAWLWIAVVEQEAFRRGEAKAAMPAKEAWTQALTLDANLRRWAKTLGMP